MKVHVVAPTFREADLVARFLERWSACSVGIRLVLVNGDPGDRTSAVVSDWGSRLDLVEIAGRPDLYWSGLCCLGLRAVAETAEEGDFFLLTNVDVRPEGDPLRDIFADVGGLERRQVAIPVVGGTGTIVSAGVSVRSWCLSLNRHIGEGMRAGELPPSVCIPATYLPTRFLLVPVKALRDGCFPDEARLPHYCADYEYSNRLRLRGYAPVVYTGAIASLSEENTGFDTFLRETTLLSRLRRVRDIKCPYHLGYRYRFVRLVYPWWSQIPGMASHFAKVVLEIALGGRALRRLRGAGGSRTS